MAEREPCLDDVFDALGGVLLGNQIARARRADGGAGREHVDGDVVRLQFRGRALHEAVHCGFGGGIDGSATVGGPLVVRFARRLRRHGTQNNDPPRAPLFHFGHGGLYQLERRAQIVADGVVEHRERHARDRRVLGLAAAVHQDIEPARERHRTGDERLHIGIVLDVRHQWHGTPTGRFDQRHGFAQCACVLACGVEAARAHHHGGAFGREPLRHGAADAAAGTRDECDLALKECAHACVLLPGSVVLFRARSRPPRAGRRRDTAPCR